MASSDERPQIEGTSQPEVSLESGRNWPRDRKQAFQWLYDDYRRRAASTGRSGWTYLLLTFVLLGMAIAAVIAAPLLARQDVEMETPKELRIKIVETIEQLTEVENELAGLRFTDFTDVVIGAERGIVVGNDGTLLTSRRNQTDWVHRSSTIGADINAVAIDSDGENAVAVGDNGSISVLGLRGRNWLARDVLTTKNFSDVVFQGGGNRATAIAVGNDGAIEVSHDGGRTWEARATKLVGYDLDAITFVGVSGTAIAVGDNGVILHSIDGGDEWAIRDPGNKDGQDLYAVESLGNGVVVAVGERGTIRVSSDGGRTWWHRGIRDTRDDFLAIALSANGGFGVAVGDDGLIATSSDNFTGWSTRSRNITERFNAIVIAGSGKTAVAAGEAGAIIVSTDKGNTWEYIEKKSRNEIQALSFDGKVAMFVGEKSTVLRGEIFDGLGVCRIRDSVRMRDKDSLL